MGTLLWQLNDCWPVTSWSITDYNRKHKAAWYAVKEVYRDDITPAQEGGYPKDTKLQKPSYTVTVSGDTLNVSSSTFAKYVCLSSDDNELEFSNNYFNLYPGSKEVIILNKVVDPKSIKVISLYDVLHR